jgi:hypothetical protein
MSDKPTPRFDAEFRAFIPESAILLILHLVKVWRDLTGEPMLRIAIGAVTFSTSIPSGMGRRAASLMRPFFCIAGICVCSPRKYWNHNQTYTWWRFGGDRSMVAKSLPRRPAWRWRRVTR